jgi:hypothetical protein
VWLMPSRGKLFIQNDAYIVVLLHHQLLKPTLLVHGYSMNECVVSDVDETKYVFHVDSADVVNASPSVRNVSSG